MQKFEINNPEALKLIADFKSGTLYKPVLEKLYKLKPFFVAIGVVLCLLIFVLIGKSLSKNIDDYSFVPPNLIIESEPTINLVNSPYSTLKEEIFNFSTDLPDPIIPDLSNTIDLNEEIY